MASNKRKNPSPPEGTTASNSKCPQLNYHYFGDPPRLISTEATGVKKFTTAVRQDKGTKFDTYRDLMCIEVEETDKYTKVKCYLCNKSIICNPAGVVSNFFQHLYSRHKDQLTLRDGFEPSTTGKPSTTGTAASSNANNGNQVTMLDAYKRRQITPRTLSEIIAHGPYPVNIVQNTAFRSLLQKLGFEKLPNMKTIRKDVKNLCDEEELQYLKSFRDDNISFVATTTDATTGKNSQPYMCITGHLITKSWELIESVLAVEYFPNPHTKENVLERFQETIKNTVQVIDASADTTIDMTAENTHLLSGDSNLIVHAVVHDAASNNNRFQEHYIALKCFGHRLNTFLEHLCEKKRHSDISTLIHNVNDIMQMIKNSTINRQQLAEVQKGLGQKELMPFEHRFSSTRWTGVVSLIERSEKLFKNINELFGNRRGLMYFRSGGEEEFESLLTAWSRNRDFLFLLLPFFLRVKYWICKTESSRYPTISLVLYAIDDLTDIIGDIKRGVTSNPPKFQMAPDRSAHFQEHFLNEIRDELKIIFPIEYWQDNKVLQIARILDIRCYLKKPDLQTFIEYQRVLVEMFPYFVETKILSDDNEPVTTTTTGIQSYSEYAAADMNNFAFSKGSEWRVNVTAFLGKIDSFDFDNADCTDPLTIFAGLENDLKCQMICKVAKAILCIPAQSASSERVFSRLSLVVDKKRTRLNKFFAAQLVKSSMRYTQKKSFEKTQKMSEHKRRNTFFKKFPPQGRCCITKDMFDQKVTEIEDAEDQFDGDFEPGDLRMNLMMIQTTMKKVVTRKT